MSNQSRFIRLKFIDLRDVSDNRSKFHVDLEGLGRLCSGCHRAA